MEFRLDDDVRDEEVAQLLDSAVVNKKDKSERQWKETSTASILARAAAGNEGMGCGGAGVV